MSSSGAPHPRRITLIAALMLGLALALAPIGTGRAMAVELTLAVVALVALVTTVAVWPRVLGVCLVAFIVEFVTHQMADGASVAATILYAAGLLTLGQLCGWVAGDDSSVRLERQVVLHRAAAAVVVAGVGALVSLLSLIGGSLALESAFAAIVVGIVGGCALLALVLVTLHPFAGPTAGAPHHGGGATVRSTRRRESPDE